jgi:hypothetical protein
MTTTTPTPPVLTGRHIGAASRATGALLDQLLDRADLPFGDWTVLFTLAGTGPLAPDDLVRQQADGLKLPEATARATVDGLQAVFRPLSDAVGRITVDLYGDLPPADLEATRRTLEEVTRRANARLAG